MSYLDAAFNVVKGKGEDLLARVPVLGPLLGAETSSHKALIAKQKQMAEEARKRQEMNQQARMNMLGQQLLAFNPMNQVMAQMFGPEAAFTPEQMAGFGQNPMRPQLDPSLVNYTGGDPRKLQEVQKYIQQKKAFDEQEARRRELIMGGFQQPGPGPQPFAMSAPQPGRKL